MGKRIAQIGKWVEVDGSVNLLIGEKNAYGVRDVHVLYTPINRRETAHWFFAKLQTLPTGITQATIQDRDNPMVFESSRRKDIYLQLAEAYRSLKGETP